MLTSFLTASTVNLFYRYSVKKPKFVNLVGCFLKINLENTNLMLCENCSCCLNLMFFYVFYEKKEKNQTYLSVYFVIYV